jgi:hypothetical protein
MPWPPANRLDRHSGRGIIEVEPSGLVPGVRADLSLPLAMGAFLVRQRDGYLAASPGMSVSLMGRQREYAAFGCSRSAGTLPRSVIATCE